jgi:hypothetical protein
MAGSAMTMFEPGSSFWRWLADQPAFIEVGIGMCFVLVIAPAALTAVAIVCTRAEALVGSVMAGRINAAVLTCPAESVKRRLNAIQAD